MCMQVVEVQANPIRLACEEEEDDEPDISHRASGRSSQSCNPSNTDMPASPFNAFLLCLHGLSLHIDKL